MGLAISIYIILLVLVIWSVKIFHSIRVNKVLAEREYSLLQNQLVKELNNQKIINQKLKLIEDLNKSLIQRLFKIVSDLLQVKMFILKEQFE